MKIFLTEHRFLGNVGTPRIEAINWDDAESICPEDLKVIGEFKYEVEL